MRRLLAWCRSHPWITGVVAFIGFWIGLHFFLEWRSERAWQRYAAEARARGVKITLMEFTLPEIPDDENFARLPMLRTAFTSGKRVMELPQRPGRGPRFGDPSGERVDWEAWQEDFQRAGYLAELTNDPVRDTLRGLEHYAPQIQEWKQWRTRPRCCFPLDLKSLPVNPLPHLPTLRDAGPLFGLQMRAHLALHDSAAAYADFRDGFQAYLVLHEEPTLIGEMSGIITLAHLVDPVGDGLRDRVWTDTDLRQIEADLSQFHPWQDYRRALEYERAGINTIMDGLAASPASRASILSQYKILPFQSNLSHLVPSRIFRDNQLRQNRYFDELLARVSPSGEEYDLDRPTPSSPRHTNGRFEELYFFSARYLSLIDGNIHGPHVMVKSRVDLVRIACALERFRQARGAFPAALEELTPEFLKELPIDTYAGKPYRYGRTAAGSFRLYSVGEDRIDNGGAIERQRNESDPVDDIWYFAPPAAAP